MTLDFGDELDDAFTGGVNGNQPTPTEDDDYVFPHVGAWVVGWLSPATAMKLSDGGRGRVWCAHWFEHPPVHVRLDALWRAWEKAVRSGDDHALIGWYTYDYDPTMRALTDGESGPMHACSPTRHVPIDPLPVAPLPPGLFDSPTTASALLHPLPTASSTKKTGGEQAIPELDLDSGE
ncbi:DUF4913 domain-containing protein [Nocardia sp. 2]|uniref:DUF4913 domain-containing protein n=1 Tax=Nocardia acididurans TaxID=2802282 RepID=A0ABS1MI03_9NOCA|nr:DUF4913 domain-containing protein [Nocardia acididurans]MBL1080296.1 DUF4913 domain-containing protein [Nocardia acididurans]